MATGPLGQKTIENPWTFWENMFFVTKVSGDFQNWGLSNMGIHIYIYTYIYTYIHTRMLHVTPIRLIHIHTRIYTHIYICIQSFFKIHIHTHVQIWCIKWVVNCNFHTVVAKQVLSVGWSKVGWNIKNEVYVTYPRQLWHPIFIPMSRQSFWWDPHSFNEGPCSHIILMLLQDGWQWLVG